MRNTNFESIERCWVYQAPSCDVQPAKVRGNTEVVEVILGGKVLFDCGDGRGERVYGPGTIFWHQSGDYTVHRSPEGEPYRCLSVRLHSPGGRRLCGRIGFWRSAASLELFVADALVLFNHSSEEENGMVAKFIGYTLLRQMRFDHSARLPAPLKHACAVIEQDPAAPLSVESLAEQCCVSKSHLFWLFRRHLNSSPYRYMLCQRLKMARNLLIDRDMPIKLISESCGFGCIEVFYRHFRQSEGMTPADYRRFHAVRSGEYPMVPAEAGEEESAEKSAPPGSVPPEGASPEA